MLPKTHNVYFTRYVTVVQDTAEPVPSIARKHTVAGQADVRIHKIKIGWLDPKYVLKKARPYYVVQQQ